MGHNLSIENHFSLSKDSVLEVINKFLKAEFKISDFSNITPESLLIDHFSKKSPKVGTYDTAKKSIYSEFEKANKKTYKITTKDGLAFESLSPGWKSAVLLDIILGYDKDVAPLIIDQPEDDIDNRAIDQIVKNIWEAKRRRQLIFTSHNANLVVNGDAELVVCCDYKDSTSQTRGIIKYEGSIDSSNIKDEITTVMEGGEKAFKLRKEKYGF